jgi:hypothetical protein
LMMDMPMGEDLATKLVFDSNDCFSRKAYASHDNDDPPDQTQEK